MNSKKLLSRFSDRFAFLEGSYGRGIIGLALILIGSLLLFSYFGSIYTDRLYDFRRGELKRLVDVALSVIQPVRDQQQHGEITQEQAIAIGRELIRRMTFTDGANSNYVFMGNYAGDFLVEPAAPERETSNQLDLVDPYGTPIVRGLIQAATGPGGAGYVEYYFPPPGSTQPEHKISYVAGIPEWSSYIGAGLYTGDIDAESQAYIRNSLLLTTGLFAVLALALYLILRPIFSSQRTLLSLFDQIIRNPDASPVVPIEQYPRGTEGWQLLAGFRDMLRQIRQSKQQLQVSEERFDLAMRGTNDGVWDWEIKTNRVYFSPRWKNMLGYDEHELPDRFEEWSQRIHPDDVEHVMVALNDYLAGRAPSYDIVHRLQHKDGAYRWIRARGVAVRDAEGRAYRMVGSHSDITESKKVEEALQRRDAILEAVTFAAERFLETTSAWEENIQGVLARLGEATGVSRVYILENHIGEDGDLLTSQRYEWVAAGISRQIDNPQLQNLSWRKAGFGRWQQLLSEGQLIWSYIRDLPPTEQALMTAQGTLSLVIVPIFVDQVWWGLIGLDECAIEREWSTTEMEALRAAASTLGSSIQREQAEAALHESEERFRMVAENSAVGFWQIAVDGTTTYLNPAMRAMLELDETDDLASVKVDAFVAPASREAYVAEKVKRRQGIASTYEIDIVGKQGHQRRVLISGVPLLSAAGELRGQIGVFTDITERKRVEEALQEREEQYRSIFEATSDGLIIYSRAGQIVEANPAICKMHGYTYKEFLALAPTAILHPDYQYLFAEYIQTVNESGQFQARSVNLRKDGSSLHVEMRGAGFTYRGRPAILGVVRDITERVQAYQMLEQRVEERTRELSTLLEVAHNMTSTLELKPLLRLILNQLKSVVDYTGATIFTLKHNELTILDYQGPIPQEQVVRLHFPLAQAGANAEVIRRSEPIIIADVRDDSPLARAFRTSAGDQLETTYGYIRSWLGVPLTVQEQVVGMLTLDHREPNHYTPRHAQLALAIANQAAIAMENSRLYWQAKELAALEERQRLARELHDSVSQALYGIALGARTARTQLDRDPKRAVEPLDYVLSLAEAGLAEMRALIFELRPESLKTDGLVTALAKQAAALRARHNIEVHTDLCEEPDLELELKDALYRIAQEALHNIVKHARATRVDLALVCDEHTLLLEIKDNGVGFDSQGTFPGHLGLRSMRERAMRLGGGFSVKSEPGQGTRIRARIPIKP